MADIKKIKIDSTIYDIKDATAARSNHTHSQYLTSHQSIKNLDTASTSALNVASESVAGSGTIYLNGISKTAQEEYLQ